MNEQAVTPELFSSLSGMPSAVTTVLHLFTSDNLNWKPKSWDGIP